MRIAIASSGLGHVARGIETWALDLATALTHYAATVPDAADLQVTLFAASKREPAPAHPTGPRAPRRFGVRRLASALFQRSHALRFSNLDAAASHRIPKREQAPALQSGAMPPPSALQPSTFNLQPVTLFQSSTRIIPCFKRGSRSARVLARSTPGFAWRWGLKSVYGWEQFSFWLRLAPRLRRGGYDILHVQDPMLAFWCRAWRRRGWLNTREILAHGTEEPPEFIRSFEYVQHLAPWHQEAMGVAGDAGKNQNNPSDQHDPL